MRAIGIENSEEYCEIAILQFTVQQRDRQADQWPNPSSPDFPAEASPQQLPAEQRRPPRNKPGEWFIKGPIPGRWLSLAAKEPGKTLHVSLALWYEAGLTKRRTVRLTGKLLKRFGVGRDAARRALIRLESIGLVTVDRKRGRCPSGTNTGSGRTGRRLMIAKAAG